jgi:hypothetical protein
VVGYDWIHLAQVKDIWRALMYTAMILWLLWKTGSSWVDLTLQRGLLCVKLIYIYIFLCYVSVFAYLLYARNLQTLKILSSTALQFRHGIMNNLEQIPKKWSYIANTGNNRERNERLKSQKNILGVWWQERERYTDSQMRLFFSEIARLYPKIKLQMKKWNENYNSSCNWHDTKTKVKK